MKKIFFTCCTLALLAIAGPASAKDADEYAVRKIEYKNKGAYRLDAIEIKFKVKKTSGKSVTCTIRSTVDNGSLTDIKLNLKLSYDLKYRSELNLKNGNPDECKNNYSPKKQTWGYVPKGSEVWARVLIKGGETENCHKGSKVKFYYHPSGGTVTYVTKGTSLNNNRCRIQSKGGVLWKDVQ